MLYFIRSGFFLLTIQSVSLMDTQANGKANNETVIFLLKRTEAEQVECSKHRVPKIITRYNLTFLFSLFPDPV